MSELTGWGTEVVIAVCRTAIGAISSRRKKRRRAARTVSRRTWTPSPKAWNSCPTSARRNW